MTAKESDLYAELRAAAKRANQRLVRLEQAQVDSPAYKIAVNDIENTLNMKSGKPRFSVSKNMTYNQMQKEMKVVNRFLNSTSSTRRGMTVTIKKRSSTLYKRYGATKLDSLFRILSSESYKKLAELLPSGQVVQAVSDALNNGASEKSVDKTLKKLIKQESDEYLIDTMNDMLGDL